MVYELSFFIVAADKIITAKRTNNSNEANKNKVDKWFFNVVCTNQGKNNGYYANNNNVQINIFQIFGYGEANHSSQSD